MLVVAAAALIAGSATVAVIAPVNLMLAVALGPVSGSGAAVLAAILVACGQRNDEQGGTEPDTETDRMVAAFRDIGRQTTGPSGPAVSDAAPSRVA